MVRQSNILVQRKIPKATGQRLMCCGNDKNRRTKHIVLILHSIVKKIESEKQIKSDTACFFGGIYLPANGADGLQTGKKSPFVIEKRNSNSWARFYCCYYRQCHVRGQIRAIRRQRPVSRWFICQRRRCVRWTNQLLLTKAKTTRESLETSHT